MKDLLKVKGRVTVTVFDAHGNVRRKAPNFLQRLLGLEGGPAVTRHHNIVTREGDALIADALLFAPAKLKPASGQGFIQVGTGWTGNSAKTNTRCNTPAGNMKELDGGYPVLKAEWGAQGDNTLIYRATFEAGRLNANGINEAALLNGNAITSNCLAYAQITPSANVTSTDTLQIVWEITFLGQ
jgi:hypothetical protein